MSNITKFALMSFLIFYLLEAEARDFGIVGKTSEIVEKDAIEEIQAKLMLMEQTGALDEHNNIIKEKITNAIKNPKSLGVPASLERREFLYDPSIVLQEDLKDEKGVVFHKAGTKINGLEMIVMPYKLIFFNAEDKKQLEFALEQYEIQEIKPKLILTGGSPIEVEKEYGLDVFFDQQGVLIKKLGIMGVPAVVEQDGKYLKIREMMVN
jgi:conjugal transfer pilus assembly protein TraW